MVTIPAGALPTDTVLTDRSVTTASGHDRLVPSGDLYLDSFAVSWQTTAGTAPSATRLVTITINDPALQPGDAVLVRVFDGFRAVGFVKRYGIVAVDFTSGETFLVVGVPAVVFSSPYGTVGATASALRSPATRRCRAISSPGSPSRARPS